MDPDIDVAELPQNSKTENTEPSSSDISSNINNVLQENTSAETSFNRVSVINITDSSQEDWSSEVNDLLSDIANPSSPEITLTTIRPTRSSVNPEAEAGSSRIEYLPRNFVSFPTSSDSDGDDYSTDFHNTETSSSSYPGFDSIDDDDNSSSNSLSTNNSEGLDENYLEVVTQSYKKPNYKWNSALEIIYRENGLTPNCRKAPILGNNLYSFQNNFYASRQTVEKMKLLHKLEKHQGCVNSLNFNKTGDLLVTGSDDLKIILWNWATKKHTYSFRSGHTSNVFQAKFFNGTLGIVSSSRDGQVRFTALRPCGSQKVSSRNLVKHEGAVHKISITPDCSSEILTVGGDGHISRIDVREASISFERLATVKDSTKCIVPLYSIAHHPNKPEFCVCGRNQNVHVFDRRNPREYMQLMCPKHLENKFSSITCAVYNATGSEIVASYSEEDIYLFNNLCYISGHYTHQYKGHCNRKTIKGVNFYGPNSEYIVSGSDCGNIFFWHKDTESIINWINADRTGVVNCLEPHPSFPVLATSGLDPDVKIFAPMLDQLPPPMKGFNKCIKSNLKRSLKTQNSDRTLFFFIHQCLRNRRQQQEREDSDPPPLASSSDDEDDNNIRTHRCSPQ